MFILNTFALFNIINKNICLFDFPDRDKEQE